MDIDYGGPAVKAKVHSALVQTAQKQEEERITYMELAELMGLETKSRASYSKVSAVLSEIAADDIGAKRPMLCAVAVKSGRLRNGRRGKPRKPGKGFYRVAHRLGRLPSPQVDITFWEAQLSATRDAWRPIKSD